MSENGRNSLTITDNRNGNTYDVDILDGDVIRAMELRGIRVADGDFGMMSYDPAFKNTARRLAATGTSTAGCGTRMARGPRSNG